MKIIKPRDLISKNAKIMLYGASGVGKTYLAGSCKNAIMLDLEKGSASVKNQDIDIVSIGDAREFREAIEWVSKQKYETIIIDSLTRYSEMLFIALKSLYPNKKDSMNLWGEFDTVSRTRIEEILAIQKNIIVVLLEEMINDDNSLKKFPMYKANKFKQMLPTYFDLVSHITVNTEGKRMMVNTNTYDAIGKNRFTNYGIPDVINEDDELYDIQKILDKLNNKGVTNE